MQYYVYSEWTFQFWIIVLQSNTSMCLSYIYFLHIGNSEHHFSFWSHLGMGLASLRKPLKLYMWRLHLQLPNGFRRQPEYSSFLFLWVPGQLDSNVKHCCKLRKSTEQRPIYLLFKAPPLSPLFRNAEVPIIFVNTRHCFSSTEAELFVHP